MLRKLAGRDKSIIRTGVSDEAVLVLVGLGNIFSDWRIIERFYAATNQFDVLIPDYIDYRSIADSVLRLDTFMQDAQLTRYRRVHIFAYILGGWVFNQWLQTHTLPNLGSVIYDRSPWQELAPVLFTADFPRLVPLITGAVTVDLARTPYPAIDKHDFKIGLMIENRAAALMRRYRYKANVSWEVADLHQPCDDWCYIRLDHYQMYKRFDVSGSEILHFFQHGRFSAQALREPDTRDPFSR